MGKRVLTWLQGPSSTPKGFYGQACRRQAWAGGGAPRPWVREALEAGAPAAPCHVQGAGHLVLTPVNGSHTFGLVIGHVQTTYPNVGDKRRPMSVTARSTGRPSRAAREPSPLPEPAEGEPGKCGRRPSSSWRAQAAAMSAQAHATPVWTNTAFPAVSKGVFTPQVVLSTRANQARHPTRGGPRGATF